MTKNLSVLASLIVCLVLCCPQGTKGQSKVQPPIPVELLFGNQRTAMTMAVNRSIAGNVRFLNMTSATAFYDFKPGRTELVAINSVCYQFVPFFGASVGTEYHFLKGFSPNVAMHLSYAKPSVFLMLTPYFNFMPWPNLETVAIAEWKPALQQNWRLLARVQGFYAHDFKKNERERAMCYVRLGATYKKYTVGVGANFDFYRPDMNNLQNYGLFLRADL